MCFDGKTTAGIQFISSAMALKTHPKNTLGSTNLQNKQPRQSPLQRLSSAVSLKLSLYRVQLKPHKPPTEPLIAQEHSLALLSQTVTASGNSTGHLLLSYEPSSITTAFPSFIIEQLNPYTHTGTSTRS